MDAPEPSERQAIEHSLVTTCPDAVVVIDEEGRVVEFNPSAERTFGWRRDDTVGRLLAEFLVPPEHHEAHRVGLARYLVTRRSDLLGRRIEAEALRADARRIPIELTINPVRCGERTYFTAFLRDISERKSAEAALEGARARAETSSQAKTTFLASMSHELRTPLTAIMGYADLLQRYPARAEDERQGWVAQVSANADHLLALLSDLLDLSRLEQGGVHLQPIAFNVLDVVMDVVELMAPLASREGLDFTQACEQLLPREITADPFRVKQILINLLSNAIKYTPAGSLRLDVGLQCSEGGTEIVLAVHDTGIGIPADRLGDVFRPFTRLHGQEAERQAGVGLGLDIARRLAEAQGGRLEVSSEVGVGSVFSLVLPCSAADLVDLAELPRGRAQRRSGTMRRHSLAGLRVLVADDHDSIRSLLDLILSEVGAEVVGVENGLAALAALEDARAAGAPFDVACFDMSMPVLGGVEAVLRLRSAGDDTPVIALTARAMSGDRARCLEAGCSAYLSKPIVTDALYAAILGVVGCPSLSGSTPDPASSSGRSEAIVRVVVDPRFVTLACKFQDSLAETEEEFLQALVEGDLDSLRKRSHQLAGIAGSYGFAGLGRRAHELEASLRAGLELGAIQVQLNAVVDSLQRAQRSVVVGREGAE